ASGRGSSGSVSAQSAVANGVNFLVHTQASGAMDAQGSQAATSAAFGIQSAAGPGGSGNHIYASATELPVATDVQQILQSHGAGARIAEGASLIANGTFGGQTSNAIASSQPLSASAVFEFDLATASAVSLDLLGLEGGTGYFDNLTFDIK